jgi:hypothetical protein
LRTDESAEALIMSGNEIAQKLGAVPIFPWVRVWQERRWFDIEGADNYCNSANVRFKFIFLKLFRFDLDEGVRFLHLKKT